MLDFSTPRIIDPEKKTEMVSFRTGEKFKSELLAIAKAKGVDLAVLINEYVISGYLQDLKTVLLNQAKGHMKISDLLK